MDKKCQLRQKNVKLKKGKKKAATGITRNCFHICGAETRI